MPPQPQPKPEETAALREISARLDSPAFRRSFSSDPYRALERAGIDPTHVPGNILDALSDLSPEELGAIQRVNGRLSEELRQGHDGAIIF